MKRHISQLDFKQVEDAAVPTVTVVPTTDSEAVRSAASDVDKPVQRLWLTPPLPCAGAVTFARPHQTPEGQTPVRTPSNLRRTNTRMNRDDRVGRLIERQRELELDIDLERKARAQLEEEVTRLRVEGETLRAESDKLTAELKSVLARCHDLESERDHLRDELKTAQARLGAWGGVRSPRPSAGG